MKKILFALPFIAVLTACSGGGGGSSPTQNKTVPDEPVTETKKVVTSEGSGSQFLPVDNSSNVITYDKTKIVIPEGISIEVREDAIVFTVIDVDRPTELNIEFFNKETGEVLFNVSFFAENTSGRELVSKVERAISQSERLLPLEDDKKIYFYIVDMLYLQGLSTYKEKQDDIKIFSPKEQASYALANNQMQDLKTWLNQYNEGRVGEESLSSKLSSFENAIIEHNRYASDIIKSFQELNASGLPVLPNTDLAFTPTGNMYSRFIGASEYGQWVDGNWVYNPDFEFLSKIVNVNLAGTCSI